MVNINFSYQLFFFFLIISQLYGVYSWVYVYSLYIFTEKKYEFLKKNLFLTINLNFLTIYQYIIFLFYITWKKLSFFYETSILNIFYLLNFLFFSFNFSSIKIFSSLNKVTNNYVYFILFFSSNLMFFLLKCQDLIVLFIFLELYTTLYYFFFIFSLTGLALKKLTTYKNLILFYIWNSFFSSLLYSLGIFFIGKSYGSLNFFELNLLTSQSIKLSVPSLFIVVSLGWKLSLPGLHFFKIELYKYLDLFSLYFFTVVTLFYNLGILLFFFNQFFFYTLFVQYHIVIFFFFFNFFIYTYIIYVETIQLFFAFSSFTLYSVLLALLLI